MKSRKSGINMVSSPSVPASLHERISLDLASNYHDNVIIDPSGPDLAIRQGSKVALVEVKTGDPNSPLPSSTAAQMGMLTVHAKNKVDLAQDVEIVPVLVTNYQVSPADRQELGEQGIKIVEISLEKSAYNTKDLVQNFSNVVGFEHDKMV